MHMRRLPLFLVCTEICEHQLVGSVTGVMTMSLTPYAEDTVPVLTGK